MAERVAGGAQAKMDAIQPMRPLLHAPAAQCTLAVASCGANTCATIANKGKAPCLYMELQLRDPAQPSAPQFHAAFFSDNFVTVGGGESVEVTVKRLPFRDGGGELQLCATGWNVARACVSM